MKARPSIDKCQWCNEDLRRYATFYDAADRAGHWGWFCRRCFIGLGLKIGLGRGQEYDSETSEKVKG
jgi:hypothetical protein